jgi:hypothetical protein
MIEKKYHLHGATRALKGKIAFLFRVMRIEKDDSFERDLHSLA